MENAVLSLDKIKTLIRENDFSSDENLILPNRRILLGVIDDSDRLIQEFNGIIKLLLLDVKMG